MGKLNSIEDKQESHQRTTLIVLKRVFCKIDKQKWRPEPTLKNGAYSEKPYE
jgi:hypothetical protein